MDVGAAKVVHANIFRFTSLLKAWNNHRRPLMWGFIFWLIKDIIFRHKYFSLSFGWLNIDNHLPNLTKTNLCSTKGMLHEHRIVFSPLFEQTKIDDCSSRGYGAVVGHLDWLLSTYNLIFSYSEFVRSFSKWDDKPRMLRTAEVACASTSHCTLVTMKNFHRIELGTPRISQTECSDT